MNPGDLHTTIYQLQSLPPHLHAHALLAAPRFQPPSVQRAPRSSDPKALDKPAYAEAQDRRLSPTGLNLFEFSVRILVGRRTSKVRSRFDRIDQASTEPPPLQQQQSLQLPTYKDHDHDHEDHDHQGGYFHTCLLQHLD